MSRRDPHGQPITRAFNAQRIKDRGVDELVGICRGVLADGAVCQAEAEFLLKWLDSHEECAMQWPGNILLVRIEEMLMDGVLDATEMQELHDILLDLSGQTKPPEKAIDNQSTRLPFDNPLPEVRFENRLFCFTGKFAFGTRADCENTILARDGKVSAGVVQNLNYLVIGTFGSRDWIHSPYGRKIEKAVRPEK